MSGITESTSFISYTPTEVREIGRGITAELSQDIIENLLEIKLNNRFIRRKSPIKLRYTMTTSAADAWRQEKEEDADISDENKFLENLNSNLNKLSEANYNIIEEDLIKLFEENTDRKFKNISLDTIFLKSISEHTYSFLYAKLITVLINIYGVEFKTDVLEKTESFYETNISKTFLIDTSKITYDELCNINKEKSRLIGSFTFIGGLYENDIIKNPIVLKYFNTLMSSIDNDENESIEKYVECLCMLVSKIGKKLEKELDDSFDELIMNKLTVISNNKTKYKPRTRFLIMDLFDLRKRNWGE